ncbi:4-(cytidine 5'-diphospho)-2-C-methyl-D-erythritol kinase [Liquorilactobacillus mali]|uniref:4-diphosphocytidyl-2-C-methyl-D-erythritol kinase n=1 Tax=Liquorilactobacillus mali KCTC 3596 = DSM 20444 TaxID=1046596 RepID=J0L862_9LACO|nr:4-(cytidine 5'-diphospho)-2-C-methyl-D-erythritol kinase [Liquorilactobacillus mali]EJF02056.1 4-diphosphocytidyl-2-C-methyl-D-erythritol kinase [Liquorilactobacillus mali KCTC 3596 = DSM 20444]KRN09943.1 4-diphosphocytidyl-2-C-methyl-D-erythritol kinase [Liquorilactobacillus mali KCTC 3596 = DSM 20444]MDC7953683.1 4-(cytidine 5'-diphospho)-2-C-methyl-D-erythritol kinase [Liquorilactobacillus mali]MDV7758134.1 4-(cytidine 5'-diphospho)-2-C-methyl-D-erythritol kinase [Liquorilactobacillus mal
MEIIEKAPAKINLSLDTPFRNLDGSPEWRMVMTAVDLADYVKIESASDIKGIQVETDAGFLPQDQRNLAYQAAKKMQQLFAGHQGVRIKIKKNIPVAAGMGGGSADAAAVLRGLNKMWKLNLTRTEMAKIGLTIDSDVPFCVFSETALVTGKGEIITPLGELTSMWIVIAKPRASVSTPTILKKISYSELSHQNVDEVVESIKKRDSIRLFKAMGNTLEDLTIAELPEVAKIKDKMISFGAQAAQMTGSGPTVFGLCSKMSRAQHVYNSLKGFCDEVYLVRPCNLD